MARTPPFIVRLENKPGSFGEIMNDLRAWLDHRKIQPTFFKAADNAEGGVGFEIAFNSEEEAFLFEREFVHLIRPGSQSA